MSSASLFSRLYDPVMELPERAGLRRLRAKTLQGVRGRVLKLGIGTGRNLPLYPPSVERLCGIDPDEIMLRRARERSKHVPFPVDLRLASAEELPFEDETFAAVTATLVFCTVADPPRAGEIRAGLEVLLPELRLVAPSVLVLLGNVPAKALIDRSFAMGSDRGVWSESVLGTPAIATYHPAYLIRLRGTDFDRTRELVVSDLVAAWERARRAADGD
jgi:hypothetical protein